MTDVFEQLLTVQEHDTALDRLAHRRRALPEREALSDVEAKLRDNETRLADATARRDEVARRQSRFEDEVALVEDKIADVNKKLYSGSISAPRELQALQADVASLEKHKGELEDSVLEAMETREPLDDEVAVLEKEVAGLTSEAATLRSMIESSEREIDAEIATEATARAAAAEQVAPDLLKLYDSLRSKLAGIGIARLEHGRCNGCHLSLAATELERIKKEPADAVVRCESCTRILVR